MAEQTPHFGGTMAESYDRYLVPMMFESYAKDLAARVPYGFAGPLLEIACGTGAVTAELAKRASAEAEIIATDLSVAMLDYARRQSHLDDPRIEWKQADASALPFEDSYFESVVCQFGAMFFPDKVGAFRQAKRVLRPGGRLIFSVWADMPEIPIFHAMEIALGEQYPDEPKPILPSPIAMADKELVLAQLREAGFENVKSDRVRVEVRGFPALHVFLGFVNGTPVGTFLAEKGLAIEEAKSKLLPHIVRHLGDPIHAEMMAVVYEAQ